MTNAFSLIALTEAGMVTEERLVHFWNAFCSMLVMPSGRSMKVSATQSENDSAPILVTVAGMVIDLRVGQSLNARL